MHLDWLQPTPLSLTSNDGKVIEVWKFCHLPDQMVLSTWAKHFRDHYCQDDELDELVDGTGLTKAQFLVDRIFPDEKEKPGPSIRSGDFAEVLIADFIEHNYAFWVPRTRYNSKTVRNESTKGSDVIGFKFVKSGIASPDDQLAIYEVKAALSTEPEKSRMMQAVIDSAKDEVRKGESLNAIKRNLLKSNSPTRREDAKKVRRFQDFEDRPYKEICGAAAVYSTAVFDAKVVCDFDTSSHPKATQLTMLLIYGDDLMQLVHELYDRAANEA